MIRKCSLWLVTLSIFLGMQGVVLAADGQYLQAISLHPLMVERL